MDWKICLHNVNINETEIEWQSRIYRRAGEAPRLLIVEMWWNEIAKYNKEGKRRSEFDGQHIRTLFE